MNAYRRRMTDAYPLTSRIHWRAMAWLDRVSIVDATCLRNRRDLRRRDVGCCSVGVGRMSATGESLRALSPVRDLYARQSQMTVFGTVPSLRDVQQNFSDSLAMAVGINTPARAVEAGRVAVHPGRGHVLPTPGRFAGLENREEVIAKPCTFNGSSKKNEGVRDVQTRFRLATGLPLAASTLPGTQPAIALPSKPHSPAAAGWVPTLHEVSK